MTASAIAQILMVATLLLMITGKTPILNFPKNLHSNTGTGDYFPKKVISS